MDWFILYADGSRVTSDDGPVENVPGTGVIVIAQRSSYTPTGFILTHKSNHYYWGETEDWCPTGRYDTYESGLVNYLARPGWKKVLFGQTIREEDYNRLVMRALDEAHATWGGEQLTAEQVGAELAR